MRRLSALFALTVLATTIALAQQATPQSPRRAPIRKGRARQLSHQTRARARATKAAMPASRR